MGNTALVWGTIDSEIRVATVGTPPKKVAEFRVNDGKTWITIKCWEELAERIPPQGTFVIVAGRIQTRSYDDSDGKKVRVTEVIASKLDVVEGGGEAADSDLFPD